MPRVLFEKTGNAVWISHLDLMRLFQRAFKRAQLPLKHTQGFNPRPSVSIALPLSVGVSSSCELLDFDLDGCDISCDEIKSRLNRCLIPGITVFEVYEAGRKVRELSLLRCVITMEYDSGIPTGADDAVRDLFAQPALIVPKKTKNGIQDQDIIPMIRSLKVQKAGENALQVEALICCQNPTLNPMQLSAAVSKYLPQFSPDYADCRRVEVYDSGEQIFR